MPGEHLRMLAAIPERDLLPRPVLLKTRTDKERFTFGRQNHDEHAFAIAPTHAAEVFKRSPARQADRVDLALRHELLRPCDTNLPLGRSDGLRFSLTRL